MDYVLPNELTIWHDCCRWQEVNGQRQEPATTGFYSGAILGLAVIRPDRGCGLPFLGSVLFLWLASIVLFGMELVTGNFALLPMATWVKKSSGELPSATGLGSGRTDRTAVVVVIMYPA